MKKYIPSQTSKSLQYNETILDQRFRSEFNQGFENEFNQGFDNEFNQGFENDFNQGFENDFNQRFRSDFNQGYERDFNQGYGRDIKQRYGRDINQGYGRDFYQDDDEFNQRNGFQQNRRYKTLEDTLPLVRQSIEDEATDEQFFDGLLLIAPTEEDKHIITRIRDDERRHRDMFRDLYFNFTGEQIRSKAKKEVKNKNPKSYREGLKKALFAEFEAVERYRDILAGIPDRYYRDMVFEILADELIHADKYNYLLGL